jgi:hypothetical protein
VKLLPTPIICEIWAISSSIVTQTAFFIFERHNQGPRLQPVTAVVPENSIPPGFAR